MRHPIRPASTSGGNPGFVWWRAVLWDGRGIGWLGVEPAEALTCGPGTQSRHGRPFLGCNGALLRGEGPTLGRSPVLIDPGVGAGLIEVVLLRIEGRLVPVAGLLRGFQRLVLSISALLGCGDPCLVRATFCAVDAFVRDIGVEVLLVAVGAFLLDIVDVLFAVCHRLAHVGDRLVTIEFGL